MEGRLQKEFVMGGHLVIKIIKFLLSDKFGCPTRFSFHELKVDLKLQCSQIRQTLPNLRLPFNYSLMPLCICNC